MKALTVCQPYAELIARGDKPIENRTWQTSYRGPLLIHAGKSRQWLSPGDEERYVLAFGAFVAQAELVACLHIDRAWPSELEHLRRHEHANGPWCWVLAGVRRLVVMPAKGERGLWIVPGLVEAQLREEGL